MTFITSDLRDLRSGPAWRGVIDHFDGQCLRGWAVFAQNLGAPVRLNVRLCGVALPVVACDAPRSEVARLFATPMRPGFAIDLTQLPGDTARALLRALRIQGARRDLARSLDIRIEGSEMQLPFAPGLAAQTLPIAPLIATLEAISDRASPPSTEAVATEPLQVIALLERDMTEAEPLQPAGGPAGSGWAAIAAARPWFPGHAQPRLPASEIGFYDSRTAQTRLAQIQLARAHGITGFCYSHHGEWSAAALAEAKAWHQSLEGIADFGLCLHWHLEAAQAPRQAMTFAATLGLLALPKACRLAGVPLLLVSGLEHLEDPAQTVRQWRQAAQRAGLAGLHLCAEVSARLPNPTAVGADSSCVLRPPAPVSTQILCAPGLPQGAIGDYAGLVAQEISAPACGHLRLGCALPGYDDSAFLGAAATIWHGSTPLLFAAWVGHLAQRARRAPPEGRAIFINAWNGWARGAFLEPDQLSGAAFLQALHGALTGRAAERGPAIAAFEVEALRRHVAGLSRANLALTKRLAQPEGAVADGAQDHGGFVLASPPLLRVSRQAAGKALLERINGASPSELLLPVPAAGDLTVSGWFLLPGTDPYPALLALCDAQGQRYVTLLRHAPPRSDVPNHSGQPTSQVASGFQFSGSLQGVAAGRYQLELMRPDPRDPGLALAVTLNCEILIG